MSMKSQPTTEMLKPCVSSVQVTLTPTQDFLHPFFCTCLISQISRPSLLSPLMLKWQTCAGRSRWSMVARFGNVVLDTFSCFWWRHRGCCPGRQVPVLLCFTQTRNFMNFEVPRCKVGWKRWWANLGLAACPMLSMCLHYSRLDCYMWPPCVTVWSGPNPPPRDVIIPLCSLLGSCWCQIPRSTWDCLPVFVQGSPWQAAKEGQVIGERAF